MQFIPTSIIGTPVSTGCIVHVAQLDHRLLAIGTLLLDDGNTLCDWVGERVRKNHFTPQHVLLLTLLY